MDWLKKIWSWLADPVSTGRSAETLPDGEEKYARAAGWNDVIRLVDLLEKHKAEYVLVGGYALSFNGLTRQTGDVDILVSTTPSPIT
jgi:hypothetical protein